MCKNEAWLAAYLDRNLSEKERREVEMHLSHCPECLADLIAAKADLDDVRAEIGAEERDKVGAKSPVPVTSTTPVGNRRVPTFALFTLSRASAAKASASLAAFATSVAFVGGFFLLMLSPSWDPNIISGKACLTKVLASTNVGEMLLSSSPRIPPVETASFRGAGAAGASLIARAERSLTSASETYNGKPFMCSLLGDFYLASGEINMAELSYRRGLDPDDPDARLLNGLAVAAFRRGELAQSREYLDRALRCRRVPAEIYYNLAQLSKDADDTRQYERYLALYLEKDSSSPLAGWVK